MIYSIQSIKSLWVRMNPSLIELEVRGPSVCRTWTLTNTAISSFIVRCYRVEGIINPCFNFTHIKCCGTISALTTSSRWAGILDSTLWVVKYSLISGIILSFHWLHYTIIPEGSLSQAQFDPNKVPIKFNLLKRFSEEMWFISDSSGPVWIYSSFMDPKSRFGLAQTVCKQTVQILKPVCRFCVIKSPDPIAHSHQLLTDEGRMTSPGGSQCLWLD